MINEWTLLRLFFGSKEYFEGYQEHLKLEGLAEETRVLIEDLKVFYKKYPDVKQVIPGDFLTWFAQVRHPHLEGDKLQGYKIVLSKVFQETIEPTDQFTKDILNHFKAEEYKTEIQKQLQGSEWSPHSLRELIDKLEQETASLEDDDFEQNDPDSIAATLDKSGGLSWNLTCIQETLGSLVPGEFGIIAAPIGSGKTAFFVSLVAHIAPQVTEGTAVLWFTSEQTPKQVLRRLWGRVCDISDEEFTANAKQYREQFKKAMHGDMHRVKVFDSNGMQVSTIARKIKKYKPKLVVIDMMDHLSFKGMSQFVDWRALQKLYHAVRMLARDCPIIGSSQTNNSTHWFDKETHEKVYQHYIELEQLEASSGVKQGAMDFLITIGYDPKYPKTRFINVCKSKTGKLCKNEVQADAERGYYGDPIQQRVIK